MGQFLSHGGPSPRCRTLLHLGRAAMLALPLFSLSAGDLDPRLMELRDAWKSHRSKVAARIVAGETFAAPKGSLTVQDEDIRVQTTISLSDSRLLDQLKIPYTRVTPTFVTAEVPLSALAILEKSPAIRSVSMARRVKPHLRNDINMAKIRASVAYTAGYTGEDVLVGIVDSGIDTKHPAFKTGGVAGGKTRLLGLWDQTATHVPFSVGTFNSTKGRLWTPAEIDAGQCTETDTSGHGTHVAGSMAGFDASFPTRHGAAKKANMLFVKTTFSSADIHNGIVWMHEQAKALGKPLVVNLSLGSQQGPHDGTDDECPALDQLIESSNGQLIVVRSAGNAGDDPIHDGATVTPSGVSLPITVGSYSPDTSSQDAFRAEFYADARVNVSIRVKDSTGTYSPWFPASDSNHRGTFSDGSAYYITVSPDPESYNTSLRQIYVRVGEDTNGDGKHTRPGTYELEFKTDSGEGRIDGWIYDTGGDDQVPAGFSSPISDVTLGNEACGKKALVVAAYTSREWWDASDGKRYHFTNSSSDHEIATFSSIGPTRDGSQKPDITAGGCAVLSARSSDTNPKASQIPPEGAAYYRIMQGTSMSSPTVAGAVALLKEAHPSWTYADVLNYFKTQSQGTAVLTTPGTWNKNWGWGVIDLLAIGQSQSVTVNVAPAGPVTVKPGATATFSATVTQATNNLVNWTVSPTGPTITPTSTAGDGSTTTTFTAPSTAGVFSLTATSAEDPARSATVVVNVFDPAAAIVTVTPATSTVLAGGTQTFSASIQGAPTAGTFTWSASSGSINPTTGAWTAPATAGPVTITATSSWGPTGTATVQVKTFDLSGDGATDTLDVLQLVKRWGSLEAADLLKADLNGDGQINDADLTLLLGAL